MTTMSLAQSVTVCLQKYADFGGRGRRSEYWWFFLATALLGTLLDAVLGGPLMLITYAVNVALVVPTLAAGSRRLHDTGRSGWLQLLVVVPVIGWIPLIVWLASDSDTLDTVHGPSPKAPAHLA